MAKFSLNHQHKLNLNFNGACSIMWKNITNFKTRGIIASSFRSKNDKINENFEIGIFFSTFESRGLISSRLLSSNACQKSIIIFFKESENHEFRKKNDSILLEQVKKCSRQEPIEIRDASIRNVEGIIKKILDISKSSFSSELNWFVDMAGAPKPYFLGLLGYMRYQFRSPKSTFFYPTADYEKGSRSNEEYLFTIGLDHYMWIPYLWGRPNPTLPWTYIFLLGFEGNRSYEIYDRFEPPVVEALIGKPGFKPEYTNIVKKNNEHFLDEAKPKLIYSNAADSVETFNKLINRIEELKTNSNICFVPLGSKPHALGAALASLTDGSSSILYLMPRSFKVRDIPRDKYFWLYKIML